MTDSPDGGTKNDAMKEEELPDGTAGDPRRAPHPPREHEPSGGDATLEAPRSDMSSPSSKDDDPSGTSPSRRKEAMRVVGGLPRRPSRDEFRDARARIKALDALDDTAVVRALSSAAIRARNDNDALRLAHECAKLAATRRPVEGRAAVVAMYEHLISAIDRTRRWESLVAFTNDALSLGVVSHLSLIHI